MQPDPHSGFVVPEDNYAIPRLAPVLSEQSIAQTGDHNQPVCELRTLSDRSTPPRNPSASIRVPLTPATAAVNSPDRPAIQSPVHQQVATATAVVPGESQVDPTQVVGQFEQAFANLVGARNFETLLKSRVECTFQGGRLRIEAAHPFVLQLLQSRFQRPLREAAQAIGCEPPEPRLSPALSGSAHPADPVASAAPAHTDSLQTTAPGEGQPSPAADSTTSEPSGAVAGVAPRVSPSATGLAATGLTSGDSLLAGATPSAATATGALNSQAAPPRSAKGGTGPVAIARRLGRLQDFVAGPHAAAALAAARAFTQPEGAGPALYLFGGTGTGKTHLLEGIVAEFRRQAGGPQALLLTAEQFTNLFTTALRSHELPSFRAKLRGVDVLLIDDVDFLDGKPRVQEEFLHTLQQLESSGKRFVLAADRHPRLLSRTRPELQTRFLSGILCRVEQPDRDTREHIVVRKAGLLALRLVPESARLLATSACTSVRELEGLLHTLRNLHRIPDQPVPPGLVRQVVGEIERDCVRVVRLPDIERVVCETFGISTEDLRSARRTRTLAEPRMLAMFLARRHTRAAYAEIGAYFGGRNHATVMSAEKRMQQAVADNSRVQVAISQWGVADLVQAIEQRLLAG